MHVWFRQYAQQMGMQNVRAILPEQIDLLINTSTTDIINQIIKENVAATTDRIVTDNSKIGQINALKTLYKIAYIPVVPVIPDEDYLPDKKNSTTPVSGFVLKSKYSKIGKLVTAKSSGAWSNINIIKFPETLFDIDFSINYRKVSRGVGQVPAHFATFEDNSTETTWFPVRIIDDVFLADVLNDYVLKPCLRTPVIVKNTDGWELYIDKFHSKEESVEVEDAHGTIIDKYNGYYLDYNLVPYYLRFSYIAKPKLVKYASDLADEKDNVDSDLPEFLHVDILKHAVDLYRTAISGALYTAQQQAQNQQQEVARNNYRPGANNIQQ